MHLLIVALGSAGDVLPFVSIGRAAAARGHEVAVCTSPAFRDVVEDAGLDFLPVGTAEEFHAAMADPALWHPRSSLRVLWRVIARTLDPVHELLRQQCRPDTVLLGSLWAFSARVMQERFGVPYLCAQVSPSTLLSAAAPPEHPRLALPSWWPLAWRRAALGLAERWVIDRLMAPDLDRLRQRAGLPPVRRIMSRWMHSPQGVLALFPSWFAARQPDWPQPLTFVGFPMFEPASAGTLDAGLQDFLDAGPPPVVVTAGSTPVGDGAFFVRALQAVAQVGARAVVLGGDAARLPDVAAGTLLHRAHVPLAPLLARSAALWHHGGIGTAAFALQAGVPQLLQPFAHDQFDNARRLVALGVGRRFTPRTPTRVLAAGLRDLLTSRDVAMACSSARARAVAEPGRTACERAVDLAEACVRRRPVLACEEACT